MRSVTGWPSLLNGGWPSGFGGVLGPLSGELAWGMRAPDPGKANGEPAG